MAFFKVNFGAILGLRRISHDVHFLHHPSRTQGKGRFLQRALANAASLKSAGGLAPAMRGMGDAAPALPLTQGVSAGITAWNSNKQITALWSINENRNSWVGIGGIGWKKLSNNSDSAIVALTLLSAHAREKGSTVHYRDESDGMIHEMYVW
jgi:hypothetical protein